MRRGCFWNGHANASLLPDNMTEDHPCRPRQQTNYQCHGPAPTFSQEEQQEVREVQLFFDSESPKDAVDAVTRSGIEIVEHQQVHCEVINKKARDTDAYAKCGEREKQGQRD